ncbi:MAG: SMC-Scp complex subunit ScpB [Candidatus Brocadiae bacterium]|nr:SMC-Scp complex subunit ScpB [Candidatus Brocadiia bacterium]
MSEQDHHGGGPPAQDPEQQALQSGSGQVAAPDSGQAEAELPAASDRTKRVIEALLFSSDRPISAGRLAEVSAAADGREARRLVRELQAEYVAEGRAFGIEEIAGGFQLLSRSEFAPWVLQLQSRHQQETLSSAALETLAIVAYRQPITRAQVEDVRGVQSGHILRSLVEKRLLKVVGKSQELGRPLLYGTTRHFLQAFGMRSLSDLPRTARFASSQEARQGD